MRFPIGNRGGAYIAVIVFITILVIWFIRSAHAEDTHIYLRGGSAFGPGGGAPVLGIDARHKVGPQLDFYAGTLLWGDNRLTSNNWDWHAGLRTCRWNVCANIGAAYVQRVDALNGSRTNFNLGLSYEFNWHRISSIDYAHLSNAGTISPNNGRNAALVAFQLQ